VHAHSGVSCTDCHKGHYNVPPGTPATTAPGGAAEASAIQPVSLVQAQAKEKKISLKGTSNNMGAIPPSVCYQCHQETQDLERIAHPHQVLGQNNFNCTTCHDPHGKIKEATRVNLCLDCHKGAPTMAWHSAVHSLNGVACTDCHNPHPKASVARIVNVSHTTVDRPQRLPMSVDEPAACYKCHQEIYGLNSLPSHHPIKEGKMSCSSCHDPHGQALGNLKEASVNLVCYKCHAEKQGPFVWEHPPVTENCGHCHDPHGTVANNLLKQPTTFLCLRCHAGHRKDNRNPDLHLTVRAATFTNCSQCHNQIHGSDIPSNTRRGSFLR
jgi:DmsE family decaheme c-type cytochrome